MKTTGKKTELAQALLRDAASYDAHADALEGEVRHTRRKAEECRRIAAVCEGVSA